MSAGASLLLLVCVVLFCGFRVFMIWVCDRASGACKVCVSLVFEFCWWSASFTYALFYGSGFRALGFCIMLFWFITFSICFYLQLR